jgi:hypothetical protein
MLTNEQADEIYQQAFAALHSVVIDPAATPEQKDLAREKRDVLTLEYIGHAIDSIEERTRKFRKFIGEMNAVIATFGSSSTIAGIRRLQEVVDTAGGLIGAALAPLAPPAPAKRAAKRTVKKVAMKTAAKAAKKPAKKAAKKAAKRAPKKATKKATKKAAKKPAKAVRRAPAAKKIVRAAKKSPARAARRRVR